MACWNIEKNYCNAKHCFGTYYNTAIHTPARTFPCPSLAVQTKPSASRIRADARVRAGRGGTRHRTGTIYCHKRVAIVHPAYQLQHATEQCMGSVRDTKGILQCGCRSA